MSRYIISIIFLENYANRVKHFLMLSDLVSIQEFKTVQLKFLLNGRNGFVAGQVAIKNLFF